MTPSPRRFVRYGLLRLTPRLERIALLALPFAFPALVPAEVPEFVARVGFLLLIVLSMGGYMLGWSLPLISPWTHLLLRPGDRVHFLWMGDSSAPDAQAEVEPATGLIRRVHKDAPDYPSNSWGLFLAMEYQRKPKMWVAEVDCAGHSIKVPVQHLSPI